MPLSYSGWVCKRWGGGKDVSVWFSCQSSLGSQEKTRRRRRRSSVVKTEEAGAAVVQDNIACFTSRSHTRTVRERGEMAADRERMTRPSQAPSFPPPPPLHHHRQLLSPQITARIQPVQQPESFT
ncbi:hypothetical protein WMY93_014973 [Mugilogobius chulae]|uniref:Uncharacterized protein n=1 Tax=Mugilogobius chulae TaxID=88201 RepID=A0AAW0NX13_9GOBI